MRSLHSIAFSAAPLRPSHEGRGGSSRVMESSAFGPAGERAMPRADNVFNP